MNFKIRTYKKAGIEKGNLESELFYDTAEETLTKYKELFRREYLALRFQAGILGYSIAGMKAFEGKFSYENQLFS